MAAVALVVFREVLEAALIISIVSAATRGVARRALYITGGIAIGLAGASAVAAGASFIAALSEGAGQDIFNAGVLLAAVAMIAWHVLWMSSHGRELTLRLRAAAGAVKTGARPLTVLLTVVALAVLREGSELVLFLSGIAAGGIDGGSLVAGLVIGMIGGVCLGLVLYLGLLRVPIQYFFTVTNAMLMLLAAGLAASAAGFLVQSDLLPSLGSQVWDVSRVLSDDSLLGRSLRILVGYRASPAGIEVLFYLFTLMLFAGAVHWQRRRERDCEP